MLEPFRYFILVSEVKFDLGGQRSYFDKGSWKRRSKVIKQNVFIVLELLDFEIFVIASDVKGH